MHADNFIKGQSWRKHNGWLLGFPLLPLDFSKDTIILHLILRTQAQLFLLESLPKCLEVRLSFQFCKCQSDRWSQSHLSPAAGNPCHPLKIIKWLHLAGTELRSRTLSTYVNTQFQGNGLRILSTSSRISQISVKHGTLCKTNKQTKKVILRDPDNHSNYFYTHFTQM